MATAERRAGLPTVAPMLATLGQLPPADLDDQYGYEVKWDGVRAVAYLGRDGWFLVSRNDHDMSAAYPELAPPNGLAGAGLVLDGEVVAFDDKGKPSFAALQPRMHVRDPALIERRRKTTPVVYVVFDVMHRGRRDLTHLTYRERRDILDELKLDSTDFWRRSAYQIGDGAAIYQATRQSGLEGVIAKRLDSTYQAGRRSTDWIKIKHVRTQEVVVGGWTPGEGRRAGSIGALLLGIPGEKGLDFVGHVGTGFTDEALRDLGERLSSLKTDHSPFTGHLPASAERGAQWVRPKLVGEVVYAERTRDGLLRTPSWRGLRPDKAPRDVVVEEES